MLNLTMEQMVKFLFIYTILNSGLFFDWAVQTHWEASNKMTSSFARWVHSFIYSTLSMLLLVCFMPLPAWQSWSAWVFLLCSHYMLDDRQFVMWWMKTIKRIPKEDVEMGPNGEWPKTWWLNIALDQWFHIAVNFFLACAIAIR